MHSLPAPSIWSAAPLLLAALLALAAPAARAETFGDAAGGADQRLSQSLRELAETRERIAREKLPLSRSIAKLEDEVLSLRRERDRLREARDSRDLDLASLERQVSSLAEQDAFIQSRLNEFVREFESRLDISELPLYEAQTSAARLADKNASLDAEGAVAVQLEVVRLAIARVREQLGGQIYAGQALDPDGVLREGRFVALGPSVFYASLDGRVAGLVENQLNAADPVVVALPGGFEAGIAALAESGSGALPLDATLGKALKKEKARKSLRQHVAEGGVVGYVIMLLGAAALALTAFKTREIVGFDIGAADQVDVILGELAAGDREAATWRAKQLPGVVGEMLMAGVEHAEEKRGVLEELLVEKILRVRPLLERFLPFLAITAAAAPLLGLLGTVVGMIKTFQLITIFGTGDAKSLSSGISEALVTTAQGLIVAIPALIIHGGLSRMAKHKLGLLEQLAATFVNGAAAIRHLPGRLPAPAARGGIDDE